MHYSRFCAFLKVSYPLKFRHKISALLSSSSSSKVRYFPKAYVLNAVTITLMSCTLKRKKNAIFFLIGS